MFDIETKTWNNFSNRIEKIIPLGKWILELFEGNPEEIIQINADDSRQITRSQMKELTIATAKFYRQMGLQKGDIITLFCSHYSYVAPAIFGANLIGCVINTLGPRMDEDTMKSLLEKLAPKLVICEGHFAKKISRILKEQNIQSEIVTIFNPENHFRYFNDYIECFLFDEEELEIPENLDIKSSNAMIFCSSATTGPHKLITVSQHSLINTEFSTSGYKVLSFAPLLWGVTVTVFYACLRPGSCHVISRQRPSAQLFKKIVEKYQINSVSATPNILNEFAKNFEFGSDLFDCVEMVQGMGQPVTENLEIKLKRLFKNAVIINGYGTMETCSFIACNVPEERPINQKRILEGWSVKIVDNKGSNLGPKQIGMISVKRNDFKEISRYFKNDEVNRRNFDDDGWFSTGDTGLIDEDGFITIMDRKKHVISCGTIMIHPSEIENVIEELDDIIEVCVVDFPDSELFAVPAAAVVINEKSKLRKSDIQKYVEKKYPLIPEKHLKGGVYFFDRLPKTFSGKVIKYKVRDVIIRHVFNSKFLTKH